MNDNKDLKLNNEQYENNWTKQQELYLFNLLKKSYLYSWINTKTYSYYKNVDNTSNMIISIMNLILGASFFAIPQCDGHSWKNILIGILSMLLGVVLIIVRYLNNDDYVDKFKTDSIDWLILGNKIERQLILNPDKREDAHVFMKYNNDMYEKLIIKKKNVPRWILKSFVNKFSIDYTTLETSHNLNELPGSTNIIVNMEKKTNDSDTTDITSDSVNIYYGLRLQHLFEESLKNEEVAKKIRD